MEVIFELKVAAYYKNIRIIKSLTETLLNFFEFDSNTNYMLKLAVSEAAANIIEHAYKSEANKDIVYKVKEFNDRLIFILRDYGEKSEIHKIKSRELDEYQEGGLGVHLINSIMDKVEYFHLEDGTKLEMTKYFGGIENDGQN